MERIDTFNQSIIGIRKLIEADYFKKGTDNQGAILKLFDQIKSKKHDILKRVNNLIKFKQIRNLNLIRNDNLTGNENTANAFTTLHLSESQNFPISRQSDVSIFPVKEPSNQANKNVDQNNDNLNNLSKE